ncbi:MAG TPA: hypothetical protein VMJ75_09065 [Candidatus Acidoferrales bacterium]|nr:hypothetical protein [Candidatus Acidoferrales bacterium]
MSGLSQAAPDPSIECWTPDPVTLPFSPADARAFWQDQVLPSVNAGSRRVVLARLAGRIVGAVQLGPAKPDAPCSHSTPSLAAPPKSSTCLWDISSLARYHPMRSTSIQAAWSPPPSCTNSRPVRLPSQFDRPKIPDV